MAEPDPIKIAEIEAQLVAFNFHTALLLAKTDQERQAARTRLQVSIDTVRNSTASDALKLAWIKKYKEESDALSKVSAVPAVASSSEGRTMSGARDDARLRPPSLYLRCGGKFATQVHGESHYMRELSAIIGDVRTSETGDVIFRAALIPEPHNPYDHNAVAVYRENGGQVGHLTRDCASRWQPVLLHLATEGRRTITCDASAGGRQNGPVGVWLDVSLQAIKKASESMPPVSRAAPSNSVPPAAEQHPQEGKKLETSMDWKIKRGEDEFTAPDTATLRSWAANGRVVSTDYVFNPVLQRWMYASETGEIKDIFTIKASSVSTDSLRSSGLLIGLLGIAIAFVSPVIGNIMLVIGVVLTIIYYVKRPSSAEISTVTAAKRAPLPSKRPVEGLPTPVLATVPESRAAAIRPAGRTALYVVASLTTLVVAVAIGWKISGTNDQNRESVASLVSPVKNDEASPSTMAPPVPQPSMPATIDDRASQSQALAEFKRVQPSTPTENGRVSIDQIPRGSLASQVYLDDVTMTYYREDCIKPAAAEHHKFPKAMAIKEGYRPSPDCYASH
jgi:hypothetical protein